MHWLHMPPAENMDAWQEQVAQAKWLETRHYNTLARVIHGKSAK